MEEKGKLGQTSTQEKKEGALRSLINKRVWKN